MAHPATRACGCWLGREVRHDLGWGQSARRCACDELTRSRDLGRYDDGPSCRCAWCEDVDALAARRGLALDARTQRHSVVSDDAPLSPTRSRTLGPRD